MKKSLLILLIAVTMGFVINTQVMAQATVSIDATPYNTIQEAITAATAGQTISISAGTYTLADKENDQIYVNKSNITIQGAGIGTTFVQAGASPKLVNYRVFNVMSGVTGVTIKNMTIRYGNPSGTDGALSGANGEDGKGGGGIYNAGALTVEYCEIINNNAGDGGNGMAGAKGADGVNVGTAGTPTRTATDGTSTNQNGSAGGIGGAGDSGQSGTNSGSGGNGGHGGGIYNVATGYLTLNYCTVTANTAGNGGKGANGGAGGAGRAGGKGGDGGNGFAFCSLDCCAGGNGGNGGKGGDGGKGGNGGNGGNGGSGGGIYNLGTLSLTYSKPFSNSIGFGSQIYGSAGQNGSVGSGGGAGAKGTGTLVAGVCDGMAGTPGASGTNTYSPAPQPGTTGLNGSGADGWNVSGGEVVFMVKLASFTATPIRDGISLKWQTLSEVDNAGFHILRSETEKGKYLEISGLIPAEGGSSTPAAYSYADDDVKKGNTYYYKLESIEYDGDSESYGPVKVTFGKAKGN